jgi:hypothetical protein
MHNCPTHLTQKPLPKTKITTKALEHVIPKITRRLHRPPPVEEEAMATPDLEEPHHKEVLREPHKTSDAEAGMKTTMEGHWSGTRPEPLRPWIEARHRFTPREDRVRSTLQPTATPTTAGVPLTKRSTGSTTFKVTEPKAAQTPVHEPTKPDSTSTHSSLAPEKSADEARKSTEGPYS